MKKIIVLLLTAAAALPILAQKQVLGFNLTPGETYYYSSQATNNTEQEINGQKIKISLPVSGRVAFKIIKLEDTVYDMQVRYRQLAMKMKFSNRELSFSSDNQDSTDLLSAMLRAMTDEPFAVKMSKTGKILEVKNLDLIFENLLSRFPKMPAGQKAVFKQQLLQAYGEKAFRGSYEMATNIYSNAAVEQGSTWTIHTRLESGMAAAVTTTYELKEKTPAFNIITGKGKMETPDKDAYTEMHGMKTKYNLTGTMDATIKVDARTGWLIEAKLDHYMSGTAEIKDSQKLPGGLTTPLLFQNTITCSSQ